MIGQGVLKPSYAQRPGFFAGILGMLAAIAGTLLVMGFVATEADIAQRQREDLQRSLAEVLPAGGYDNDPSRDFVELPRDGAAPLRIYQARRDGERVALAFELSEAGYAGEIRLVLGVTMGGAIIGVRVLAHSETPGLGDKIERAKDDWIVGFNGRSLATLAEARWAVKKDGGQFDQFSGATITPRAVVKGIKGGLLLQRSALAPSQLDALSAATHSEESRHE